MALIEDGAPLWPAEIDLRASLEAEYLRAHELREFRESLVRRHLTHIEMQVVEDYAEAKAREIIARHKLEQCGWGF